MNRRNALRLITAATAIVATGRASAQAWPSRPVRIVTPYAAGGTSDLSGRLLAQELSTRLGVPVIVENKPGANTRLAAQTVARAEPDGHTLLWCAATHVTNPAFFADLGYDTESDFAPIVHALGLPILFIVPAASPAKTLGEYVALAKKDAKYATIGHSGIASGPHLALEVFAGTSGFNLNHVPYKGDQPTLMALLAGDIQAASVSFGTPLQHIRDGRVRALGIVAEERSPLLPDVPRFAEAGFQAVDAYPWFGLLAPAKTPSEVVNRLNREVNEILKSSTYREKVGGMGMMTIGGTPQEFSNFISQGIAKWKRVAAERNLKVN